MSFSDYWIIGTSWFILHDQTRLISVDFQNDIVSNELHKPTKINQQRSTRATTRYFLIAITDHTYM